MGLAATVATVVLFPKQVSETGDLTIGLAPVAGGGLVGIGGHF